MKFNPSPRISPVLVSSCFLLYHCVELILPAPYFTAPAVGI